MESKRKSIIKILSSKYKNANDIEKEMFETCKVIAKEDDLNMEVVYSYHAYQFAAELMQDTDEKQVLEDIKNINVDWNSSYYNEIREKEMQLSNLVIEGVKIEKGEYKCRNKKCLSDECYIHQMQTRSGDEGMTTYVTCTKCRTRYKFG